MEERVENQIHAECENLVYGSYFRRTVTSKVYATKRREWIEEKKATSNFVTAEQLKYIEAQVRGCIEEEKERHYNNRFGQ